MEYIREILNTKEETIRIKIPKEFINRNLELTIKPLEELEEERRKKLLKFLSEGPEMSDEEYNSILERRKRFDAWK
ncbi:MAG: hypothetical protein K1X86_05080 [Ignavibacteria bacterium]|nr:hypothetical protein [Ignavibacteria bacterium]